jgi:SSS family solute:Na+ symporter
MHSSAPLDYAVVVVYFAFMIVIGVVVMRRLAGVRDYFAGANTIPWWIAGVSLYMQNFSAWTFSGAAGFTYRVGWFAVLYFATWALGYYVGARLTASAWRRSRVLSPVEYVRQRFNLTTQQVSGWALALNFTLTAGVQLAATCKLLLPILDVNLPALIVVTGVVILLYTYLGGIWAVSITDMAQFAILLCITILVVPLSLQLVGGLGALIKAIPPLAMTHEYNGMTYDVHWLASFWIILTVGTAQGAAQRFYSVRDERSARRVGMLCAALFITAPMFFAIPPLVARVLWPDLGVEPFFARYAGLQQPQDLVYAAICMRVLPNGLIGMFAAAMLAATMSTLSGVYNMIAAIITRDVYQGVVRPNATEPQMLRVGRITSVVVGVIVIAEAMYYIGAPLGIFNYMQQFFSLFNIPIALPLAGGLLLRRVSRWGAFAATVMGLSTSAWAKFALGWPMGPQVYLTTIITLGVFASSNHLGALARRNISGVAAAAAMLAAIAAILAWLTPGMESGRFAWAVSGALVLGALAFVVWRMCGRDTGEDADVKAFLARLDTPVDVARELDATGSRERSAATIVGWILIVIAALVALMLLSPSSWESWYLFVFLSSILASVGWLFAYFGRSSRFTFIHS